MQRVTMNEVSAETGVIVDSGLNDVYSVHSDAHSFGFC